jgi:predicted small lipoprotein YifL
MRNNFIKLTYLTILSLGLLSACSKASKNDDPLIIPPNFEVTPDSQSTKKLDPANNTDTQKLKELLLKGQ